MAKQTNENVKSLSKSFPVPAVPASFIKPAKEIKGIALNSTKQLKRVSKFILEAANEGQDHIVYTFDNVFPEIMDNIVSILTFWGYVVNTVDSSEFIEEYDEFCTRSRTYKISWAD